MARGWQGFLLLVVPAAAWAQDSPAKYQGRTAAEWVDRLSDGDEEARRAVHTIGAPCVRLILARLVGTTNERLEGAIEEMGVQAAPALLEEAKEGEPRVRLLALYFVLCLRDYPAELDGLIPTLLADEDREVRVGAALLLCDRGFDSVAALPPLLEGLQSREKRAWAASHLWRFQQEAARVVPALIGATRDADPDVRREALASLWAFWETRSEARARILEASESKDAADRKDAVPEWGGATPTVVAFCLKAADDPDETVRTKARDALWWSWRRVKLGQNAEEALSHPRAEIRKIACETVAAGETDLLVAVLARLDDENEDVRLAALDAIARIGDAGQTVRSRLRALLAGQRSETAQRAAWTLIHLDVDIDEAAKVLVDAWKALDVAAALGKRATVAVPALREMLDAVPDDAAWALYVVTGEIEAPLAALRRQMERDDPFARLRACIVAGRFGPAAAGLVPLLVKLLDDEDSDVRRHAATALGRIGAAARPAIPKLIKLLEDREDGKSVIRQVCTHAAAALALLDVDSPRIRELLREVIDKCDPNDGSTRPGALRHMWKCGLMPVEEVVRRCTESLLPPNWEDCLPIVRLLGEIGTPAQSAIPALEDLLHTGYCRAAAEDAIRRIRPPG